MQRESKIKVTIKLFIIFAFIIIIARLVGASLVQAGALGLELVDQQPPHLHHEHLRLLVQDLRAGGVSTGCILRV